MVLHLLANILLVIASILRKWYLALRTHELGMFSVLKVHQDKFPGRAASNYPG